MSSENTITYEIIDNWTTRVTTFPNGTIFRKALHPAGEPDISQYPALTEKVDCPICEEQFATVSINQPGGAPDMRVCVTCAKEQVDTTPVCYITEIHDPALAERTDIIRRMKPTPPPPLPRLSDTCQRCGVNDNKVLPGLGYHHQECFVAKTEEEKKPKPEPKPVITYEIKDGMKWRNETYPRGTGTSRQMGPASKHEKIVALAKQTYDTVLSVTDDHAKACEMMANVFIAMYN